MKSLFLNLYRSGFLYLTIWVLTGVVGASQRFNSPMFDKWLDQNLLETEKRGYEPNVMDFLGTTPPFVLFIESIIALFVWVTFSLIYLLLVKRLPKVLKYLILLLPASFVVFTSYLAGDALVANLKWGFYILAIQDVVWFAYLFFVVSSYWKLIKAQH